MGIHKHIEIKLKAAKEVSDHVKEKIAEARRNDDTFTKNILLREFQYWDGYLSAYEEIKDYVEQNYKDKLL